MRIGGMGIDVQCHVGIRVSHQVLQVLDCHSGIGTLLSEERSLFYLFSFLTLSNSFPLWKEPELTGLFYHIDRKSVGRERVC